MFSFVNFIIYTHHNNLIRRGWLMVYCTFLAVYSIYVYCTTFPNFLKGTVKEKWKGPVIDWKIITLALDRDPWKFYLMFLSREIDTKLFQIYTKNHKYTNLYRKIMFKQMIFSNSATNLKTKISTRNLTLT